MDDQPLPENGQRSGGGEEEMAVIAGKSGGRQPWWKSAKRISLLILIISLVAFTGLYPLNFAKVFESATLIVLGFYFGQSHPDER